MAGIHLTFATQLEQLAHALASGLRPRLDDPESLFNPADIIVPNKTMQTYLEQEISRQLGVTPNIRFRLLRTFLADCLRAGDSAAGNVRVLGAENLHHILVDLLQKAYLDDAHLERGRHGASASPVLECEPIRRYLKLDGDDTTIARERRLYQLSGELARIFIEYSFSRSAPVFGPPMEPAPFLVEWNQAQNGDAALDGIAAWQRALWWQVFGDGGALARINQLAEEAGEARYITLAQAFEAFSNAQTNGANKADIPSSFYMVGFPYIARLFTEAVGVLGNYCDIHVFSLTPSCAWVDAPPAGTLQPDGPTHPLLVQWGKAAADARQMWAKLDPESLRNAPAAAATPDHLLGALQRDIICGDKPTRLKRDEPGGIQFFECPSVAREVEAVANEIWTLLDKERLRPDDIAVLIAGADQEVYQAQIDEIFPGFHGLKPVYVGLPPTPEGRILEAVQLLLDLPTGKFRRRELLRLLVHPNMRGRADDQAAEEWAEWSEKLGILFGADREEQADTYLGTPFKLSPGDDDYQWDLYNWDQGVRRVVLGQFLSGERSGVDRLFRMGNSDYQAFETAEAGSASAAQFVALTNSLIKDARWLIGPDDAPTKRSMKAWAEIVEAYLRTYLHTGSWGDKTPRKRREEDARNFSAACRAIRELGEDCPVDGAVSFRIFYEFARDAIEEIRQSGAHHLTGGVIVSTCLEMRAIPFEHVFVVGLGEGQFPNPEIHNALDLRQDDPQLGDLKPADRDRHAFLETLLAARRGITLSWVAREATTGEKLNASSVVNELRWVLESRFKVPTESKKALTVVHPLRRYEIAQAPGQQTPAPALNLHQAAIEEARLKTLRDELSGATSGEKMRRLPTLREVLRDPEKYQFPEPLKKALILPELPGEKTAVEAANTVPGTPRSPASGDSSTQARRRIRIRLSTLRNFLESPLQAAAEFQLGLREDEEDLFANEREPLAANHLYRAIVLREVVTRALASGAGSDDLETIYNDTLLPRRSIQGHLPSGHFLESNRDKHLRILGAWWKNFEKLNINAPLFPVGIGVTSDECDERYDAIQLELNPTEHKVAEPLSVEVTGKTELSSQTGNLYVTFDTNDKSSPRPKYMARSFMSWIAATAAGRQHSEQTRLLVNNTYKLSDKVAPKFITNAPALTQIQARNYLTTLVVALLNQSHDYLLPIEFAATKKSMKSEDCNPEKLQKWLDKEMSGQYCSISSQYGPIKDYARFGAPETDIAAILDERFPYISWSEK